LWEALVRSQLEYGSEILGKKKWKEAEDIQMDFCRRVLRCSSMTSKLAMRGELGLCSMQARRDLKMLVYWMNILTMDDSRLCKQIYHYSKSLKVKTNWTSTVKFTLSKYHLAGLWNDEEQIFNLDGKGNNEAKSSLDHKRFWKSFIKKRIFSVEEESWRAGMETQDKLVTLRTFKTSLRLEKYLLTTGHCTGRKVMISLRTGTNVLEINNVLWA
jgi:hypothetical protein